VNLKSRRPVCVIALILAAAVGIGCGVGAPGDTPTTPPYATTSPTPSRTAASPLPSKTSQSPTPDPKPSTPDVPPVIEKVSIEQENAARSAESYLSFTSFSRSGLIKQLKHEGFSTKAATAAVDSLNVDWMVQAEKTAQDYLEVTSFSRSSLIRQLKSEGFTDAQAKHGVSKTGL
jgi:hypothetical protein